MAVRTGYVSGGLSTASFAAGLPGAVSLVRSALPATVIIVINLFVHLAVHGQSLLAGPRNGPSRA